LEQNSTPRGSIHTNLDFPSSEKNASALGFGGKGNNNKIRVVVRMRPYLDGEPEELRKMSNVMALG